MVYSIRIGPASDEESPVLRLMRQHLLSHWGRSPALLVGILVAVSSLVALSATTETKGQVH